MASDLASLTSRIEALERVQIEDRRRLRRLEDIEALQQLKYRYFRALDSADMDLLASLLTEDFHCRFQSDRFDMSDGWKHRSSFWTRHVEISEKLPFSPNYTGRYLKTIGDATTPG